MLIRPFHGPLGEKSVEKDELILKGKAGSAWMSVISFSDLDDSALLPEKKILEETLKFFDEKLVPVVIDGTGLDLKADQSAGPKIVLEHFNEDHDYGGYFDGGLAPDNIYLEADRWENLSAKKARVWGSKTFLRDLVHELQHFELYKISPQADWDFNEGLSLIWEKVFLNDVGLRGSHLDLAVNSLSKINSKNLWDYSKKMSDPFNYGKLYYTYLYLFDHYGQESLLKQIYHEKWKSLDDVLASLKVNRDDFSRELLAHLEELKAEIPAPFKATAI